MEQPIYGIIYSHDYPNGKYIGQTTQGEDTRWKQHLRDTNAGSNLPVHNAIRKYYNIDPTKNKVERCILAYAYSLEELDNLEIKFIKKHNTFNDNGKNPNGYNMTLGGGGRKGQKYTEEEREKCRKIQQKRNEEQPEIAINHSKFMKQRAIENPDIGIQHSIRMKQLYANDPSRKEAMSKLKSQQNKDNPDMAKQQSELKLMQYEDKNATELIANLSKKSIQQWQNPDKRKQIMDEKRNRFTKPFNVYKDGILIGSYDYVPDCAFALFGTPKDSNISAALNGRKKIHKGYVFEYKL